MREMQNENNGRRSRPNLRRLGDPYGVLEDPDRVRAEHDLDVFTRNKHVASFRGLQKSGVTTIEGAEGEESLTCFLLLFQELRLTHHGSLRRLEGETWTSLLGPQVLLLSRDDRPVYASEPGADNVLVALFPTAPVNVVPSELFRRISEKMLEQQLLQPVTSETVAYESVEGLSQRS